MIAESLAFSGRCSLLALALIVSAPTWIAAQASKQADQPKEKPVAQSADDEDAENEEVKPKRRFPGRMGAIFELVQKVQEARAEGMSWWDLLAIAFVVGIYIAAILFAIWVVKKLLLALWRLVKKSFVSVLRAMGWKFERSTTRAPPPRPPPTEFVETDPEMEPTDRREILVVIVSLAVVALLIAVALAL